MLSEAPNCLHRQDAATSPVAPTVSSVQMKKNPRRSLNVIPVNVRVFGHVRVFGLALVARPMQPTGCYIPPVAAAQGARPPKGGLCFSLSRYMQETCVYVDGFDLCYGAKKNTPYRWLDLAQSVD